MSFFGEQERNRSDEEVEPSQHCQNVRHYRVKDEALHCPGAAAQFTELCRVVLFIAI